MFDARQLTIACEVPSPEAQAILIAADQGVPRWYLAAFARDLTIDVTFGMGDSPVVLFREHLEMFLGHDLHVVSRFFLEKPRIEAFQHIERVRADSGREKRRANQRNA